MNDLLSLNDLAIIITQSPIEISADVNLITLAPHDQELQFSSSRASLTGYGETEEGRKSQWLLAVDLLLAPYFSDSSYWLPLLNQDNNVYNASFLPYGKSMIVSYDPNFAYGACHQDSGGPLVFENSQTGKKELIGITAVVKGDCGMISGFTSIPYYYDWIKESLKKEGISL